MTWQCYINKRGSLHIGRRLEAGFALLAFMINRMAGGKVEMSKLMPHESIEAQPLSTDDEIIAYFKKLEGQGG